MRIATFNINNVVSRFDVLIDWLAQEEPDVVCLQELKAEQGRFPAEALKQMGYHAAWKGQRTWNGVAILARGREPVVTRTALPGEPDPGQARYIEAAAHGVVVRLVAEPERRGVRHGLPQPVEPVEAREAGRIGRKRRLGILELFAQGSRAVLVDLDDFQLLRVLDQLRFLGRDQFKLVTV